MSSKEPAGQYLLPLDGLSQVEFNFGSQTGYETGLEDAGRQPEQVPRKAQIGRLYSTGGYTADKTAPQD